MAEVRKIDKLVNLAKRRGFIFPAAEIYGGLNSLYDYGPLGVELKNNIKKAWWDAMLSRPDIVGLDSAILTPGIVWEASGHLQSFHDPLVECKKCHHRFRADHLLEAKKAEPGYAKEQPTSIKDINCPDCDGPLTTPRNFNLLMKTSLGVVEEEKEEAYLRGETCQGIYLNFLNIKDTMRLRLPFGIAQVGKAFRNEITTKNFIFRMREFEQMEMQYFITEKIGKKVFAEWQKARFNWYVNFGIKPENLRWREHAKDELAHYAKQAIDIEYRFDFSDKDGFKELEGVHNRGNWDLSRHQEFSQQDFSVKDEHDKKFIPHIIETSGGVDRATLAFLLDAYEEIEGGRTTTTESTKEVETILHLDKRLAPIKIAILPLSKKEPLVDVSKKIFTSLASKYRLQYDETAAIGRRYRRQDEIGTPYCVTVDFESSEDKKVTVRDRDSMRQDRVSIAELNDYFDDKFKN
ncbi:MAG: glycine--tRNA ligase [Patescibacteria group bacterium]